MARSHSTQIRREQPDDARICAVSISASFLSSRVSRQIFTQMRQRDRDKLRNALQLELHMLVQMQKPPPLMINGENSSSETSDSTALATNGSRRLETSASVPYALSETLRHSQSTMSVPAIYWRGLADLNSESMPNLGPQLEPLSPQSSSPPTLPLSAPPIPSPSTHNPPFPAFPGAPSNGLLKKHEQLSSSASDITSEQSGWVSNSSRRSSLNVSSGQLTPDEFNNNVSDDKLGRLLIDEVTMVNGEQLKVRRILESWGI